MGTRKESGYTLVELMIGIVLLGLIAISAFTLFSTLIRSTVIIKRKAIAATLATTQMEYLKSLPFNSLAIAGGPIYAPTYLPANGTTVLNGVTYTSNTTVDYVDDAFDGCGSYPTLALKQTYCRNYPPPSGAPATDTNPQDYKIAHVKVTDQNSLILAEVDSQISARVAETASTTGALFVKVLDDNGNPLSGATVQVVNSSVTPNVNLSDTSDSNGITIFYGLPPDTTGYDYVVNGSLSGYSSLSTIAPSGSLTPTYPSQQIITQQSSFVTLTLKPQGPNSLVIETTDTGGAAIAGMKVYVKGGYKKYTSTSDKTYYYDNMTPSDTRPTTDAGGFAALSNLVPGDYIFCSETAGTNCKVGSTTYYVAAVLPYSGNNPFNPLSVPIYEASSPPTTTFTYNGNEYLQKVRLMMTTSSSFPRVYTLTPDDVSLSTGTPSSFTFQMTGANLTCSGNPASCATSVKFTQASNTYTASCTGTGAGTSISCTINLTGISAGQTQAVVKVGSNTLTIPVGTFLGGLNVSP
jgi:prepilin-type N-terminal cleavage/methylation domain-containing protein